ncbi:MAG: glycosyltransferase [Syntrophothermus sp.]
MKVIHLISSFSAAGAEILVRDIAINTRKSITVEVWAVGNPQDREYERKFIHGLAQHGIHARKIEKMPGRGVAAAIIKLRKMFREHRPDIVHVHSELAAFYTIIASAGLNIRIAETVHNTVLLYPRLHRYFSRYFIDMYVAISEKCSDLILNVIGADRSRVKLIYNGISIEKFQDRKRVINSAVKSIIAVGRLDVQKDHETMLRAYALLLKMLEKDNITLPVLNITGAGPLQEKVSKLAETLGISDYIYFHGVRNDIPSYLYENDIWLMTSRWEGLSIALLEAMASGIPVIATDVGSNPELIDNGLSGILVPKESPEKTAEALYKLITDKYSREIFSEEARKKAAEFSIEKCTQEYALVHLRIFNDKRIKSGLNKAGITTGTAV